MCWHLQFKEQSDCNIRMGRSWPDWRQEGRRLSKGWKQRQPVGWEAYVP